MPASPGQTFTPLTSAKRSAKQTNNLLNTDNAEGATIYVDATASSGDGTEDLQVTVSIKDPESGNNVQLFQDNAFADGGTGTVAYHIGPGVADSQSAYKLIQATYLPKEWVIESQPVQGGGGTVDYTYSIAVNYH